MSLFLFAYLSKIVIRVLTLKTFKAMLKLKGEQPMQNTCIGWICHLSIDPQNLVMPKTTGRFNSPKNDIKFVSRQQSVLGDRAKTG